LPAVDAAIVTLLRLQLASAENVANERLKRLESLEEEIRLLKVTRERDLHELVQQVSTLETELRGNMEARERQIEEKTACIASMEDQLRHAHGFREEAVQAAVRKAQEIAQASHNATLQAYRQHWQLAGIAGNVATAWISVQESAESELETVRSTRQMLSVLIFALDQGRHAP